MIEANLKAMYNLKKEQRTKARVILLGHIEHRKRQKQLFEEALIAPIKEDIELAKEAMVGRITFLSFINHSKAVNKLITGLLKETRK